LVVDTLNLVGISTTGIPLNEANPHQGNDSNSQVDDLVSATFLIETLEESKRAGNYKRIYPVPSSKTYNLFFINAR
jgi:hypothetical protein